MAQPELKEHVAVTGAAGTIGSAVAERLAQDGYRLTLLDVRAPKSVPQGATFHQVDSLDADAVSQALKGATMVCHIGEIPNLLPQFTHEEVLQKNTQICRNVLNAAAGEGVKRLVYTSSCQAYGYWGNYFPKDLMPSVWPLDERQPLSPRNKYAESKAVNEEQTRSIAKAGGMQALIFRFPWVMSPRASGKVERLWGPADKGIQDGFWTLLDLRDAVEAYALAMRIDRPLAIDPGDCEAFHFVADEVLGEMPIKEKMAMFLPDFPPLPPDWPERRPPVSCHKAATLLGWRPQHGPT
jgi:nucleoside-diphosphate-sugar epimerase